MTIEERTSNSALTQKDAEKAWEELQISNDFLFSKLMQNQELCKRLLEVVLEVEIERIEIPKTEQVMKMTAEGKGVRLDVYVADENHTVYNIEMQAANTKELPKRSRYYQGIIDMDIISKGELYNTLKKSYVIFICTFDLFKHGLYKYTFENRCKENPEIVLGDDTQKIFLNATAIMDEVDIDEDLKAFLSYVNGIESENEFVQQLKAEIKKVKSNEKWRREYMMQQVRDKLKWEEGREVGVSQGISQGIGIGDVSRIILLMIKKVQKSMSLEVIAEELECTSDEIRNLYEAIIECGLECSVEDVLEKVGKNN